MGAILEVLLQVLAGVGLVGVADRFLPSKYPTYPTLIKGWGPLKIGLLVVVLVIGAMLLIFLNRRLRLNLFKRRR